MNSGIYGISNLLLSLSIKIFLLLFCALIIVFLLITIKQIHHVNRNEDYCIRQPLVTLAKFWIHVTILLAIVVAIFI